MRFYQAIDLPGLGFVPGRWDHRGTVDVYLGHTDFIGKTAIDIGTANGFWSFEMERRGAVVTALDLGENDSWDGVPYGGTVSADFERTSKRRIANLHQDFETCREAMKSKVKIVRGSVYDAARVLQPADIVLAGNVLQHLRDPFLAIQNVAQLAKQRVIISESIWHTDPAFLSSPQLYLLPRSDAPGATASWFQLSPAFVEEVLKLLGFATTKCEFHEQLFTWSPTLDQPKMVGHFTVVADRN